MGAMYKREINAYFNSPLGYVIVAIIISMSGTFFSTILSAGLAYIQYVFSNLLVIIMAVIPLLTMRLISEDKHLKIDQLLLTSPISISSIVWGKFLAAITVFFISLSITIIYMLILSLYTTPNWNIFIGNFIGVFLMGASLISIGLFISSTTESQVIAGVITYAVIMIIGFIDLIAFLIPKELEFITNILLQLSFNAKLHDLVNGILNISHLVFFVSIFIVFNFLTGRMLEKKRWN